MGGCLEWRLNKCPWCDIEASSGVPLFQVAVVGSAQIGFSIAALWGKIASVPDPGPPPALPRVETMKVALSPAAVELQQCTLGTRIAAGLRGLFGGASRIQTLRKDIKKKSLDARAKWNNVQNNASTFPTPHQNCPRNIGKSKHEVNTYTGSVTSSTVPAAPSPPAPAAPGLLLPKVQADPPRAADEDSAGRLNAQELKRLRGR